jgi:hypothetical protein
VLWRAENTTTALCITRKERQRSLNQSGGDEAKRMRFEAVPRFWSCCISSHSEFWNRQGTAVVSVTLQFCNAYSISTSFALFYALLCPPSSQSFTKDCKFRWAVSEISFCLLNDVFFQLGSPGYRTGCRETFIREICFVLLEKCRKTLVDILICRKQYTSSIGF